MRRVIPAGDAVALWDHYPSGDAVSPISGARYFYHCHPPAERSGDEHGHFHLFLPLSAFSSADACLSAPVDNTIKRADVVHIIALSINAEGLPTEFFTVNRWVTDEWLFPAAAIAAALDHFDLSRAPGDNLVNDWLTAVVALAGPMITTLLEQRDESLAAAQWPFESRDFEVMSRAPIDLQMLFDAASL